MFSVEVLENQDTDAREKNRDFLVENSATSAVFLIEILMVETDMLLAQN